MTVKESVDISNVVTYEMVKNFIDNTKANWSVDKICLDLDYLSSYTDTWVRSTFKIEEELMFVTHAFVEIVIYSVLDNIYRTNTVEQLGYEVLTLLHERFRITINENPDDVELANYFEIARHMLSNHLKLYIKNGINLAYSNIDIVYNPTITPYIIHDIYFISGGINTVLVLYVVNNKE